MSHRWQHFTLAFLSLSASLNITLLPLVIILLTAAAPGAADTAPVPADGWPVGAPRALASVSDFLAIRGHDCVVETTLDRSTAQDLARFFDGQARVFKTYFKGAFKRKEPIRIKVFSDESEYRQYFVLMSASQEPVRSACYFAARGETLITLERDGDRCRLSQEVARHELTHHLLHFYLGTDRVPVWLDEGTACFLQYWDPDLDGATNFAANLDRANHGYFGYFPRVVRDAFVHRVLVPPERLLALDFTAFHVSDPQVECLHYSESWAMLGFLLGCKSGNALLDRVLTALRDGKSAEALLTPATIESLRQAWYSDIETRIVPAATQADHGVDR